MRLRIVSWNVNSVRLRLGGIARLVAEEAPDVLCLQEVKVAEAQFPHEPLAALGFRDILVASSRGYHGVAILSKVPLQRLPSRSWCGREDGRHLAARLPNGVELHNFYVPAGGDVPDPEVNEKFAHKLQFLAEMAAWSAAGEIPDRAVVVGDINVAPLPTDVWSHRQLLKVVSHTPVEVAAYERVMAGGGWTDAVRRFVPPEQRLYSWWSYRARDWAASDRGRRLDHVWVTPALTANLGDAHVLRAARGWENPSDHVPVRVTLDI